ncbi:MAG: pyridoxine 5'-phosphate synthase [Burkholderiales bacterium]
MIRLGVNIDHIATLRNARGEESPSVIEAGLVAETNGADLITVHLREDRRHIKDDDVILLRQTLKTQLNLEMAATPQMLAFALEIRPDFVCLVPEKRQELTTEGGLDVVTNFDNIAEIVATLQENGILVSLFVDPDYEQITAACEANAYAIEIHTGKYALAKNQQQLESEFYRIKDMSELADSLELVVNAGHGLTYQNVKPIASLPHMHELNIGFAIIAQSIFWGLPRAVSEMKRIMMEER